jgi:hypothetical protein
MAVSPNTNFSAGAIYTAQQANNFPRGLMGYVVRTTGNTTLSGVTADVTGASITFTAEANRGYLITFSCTVNKPSAGYIDVQFTDASNTLIADTLQGVGNTFASISFSLLQTTNTAGSKTVKVRASTDAGVGTIYGTTGNPYTFIIQDMGPV